LLKIIIIRTWGVGFISCSTFSWMMKDDDLAEIIRANVVAYVKPLKVAWDV
jgi:hypothetical protein